MANSDRAKALRNVVDSLPLAPDQRSLALTNIRNATLEEGDRILHHFDRLERAIPAALAALDKALVDKAADAAQGDAVRTEAPQPASAQVCEPAGATRKSRHDKTSAPSFGKP